MEDNETPTTESSGKRKRKRDVLFGGFKAPVEPPPIPTEDDIPDDVGPEVPDDILTAAIPEPLPPPPAPLSPPPEPVKPPPEDPPTKPSLVPIPSRAAASPRLRRHDEEGVGSPLERRDGSPPPGAIPITLGRRRPAPYEPTIKAPSPGMVDVDLPLPAQARTSLPATEYAGRSRAKGDPVVNAIEEAFAGFGPEEHVVDVRVEVLDEATRQYWTIGQALNQPISVARNPQGYLRYNGYYRVSVAPAGENFPPRRSRHFTARIKGPQRPANWYFDESDIGGVVYGERTGGDPMGWAPQPVVPPPSSGTDPDNVLRTIRTMREIEKEFKKPEGDDDVRRKVEELEAEVRVPRWRQPNPWEMGGGGGPPMYGNRREEERRREEDERRRADEERRRVEEERRRAEAAERKAELAEMQRRYDTQMEELRRQRENDQLKWEQERKAREVAEQRAAASEEHRKWEEQRREDRERWETQQRAEKERWEQQQRENERRREEDMRRFEVQFSEVKKQNELLTMKLSETPKESSIDKLLTVLPQLWANNKSEQLAAEQRWREESRITRDREREDSQRQTMMMQEMYRQSSEATRAQAIQAQEHSRTLLEFATRDNKNDSFASLGSVLSTLMQVQTNALSSVAQMQQGNSPSPWMDVAAGLVEAVGDVAKSVIAAKFGGDPSALAGMLPGMVGGPPPQAPPVRRPVAAPAPAPVARQPVQPPTRQPMPPEGTPVAVPRATRSRAPSAQEPAPGIPRRIMVKILDAAKSGEEPLRVARRLFSMVELCDVNELAKGNPQSEAILENLMTESKTKAQIAELFSAVDVTDEDYIDAVFSAYMTLIYSYVKVIQGVPDDDDDAEGEDEDEAPPGETPEEELASPPEAEVAVAAEADVETPEAPEVPEATEGVQEVLPGVEEPPSELPVAVRRSVRVRRGGQPA